MMKNRCQVAGNRLQGTPRGGANGHLAPVACHLFLVAALLLFASTATAQRGPLLAEKGKFRVVVAGALVGNEQYAIAPAGAEFEAIGTVEINVPGSTSGKISSKLRLAADGRPLRYEWTVEAEKKSTGTLLFEGGTATVEVRLGEGQPFTQQFFFDSPRVVVLDNNLYHHYAILARLYDMGQKGTQTFNVFIPQELTPGTVTVEHLSEQDTPQGKLDHLRVRSTDLEIDLYVGKSGLVRLAVPAANVVVEHD